MDHRHGAWSLIPVTVCRVQANIRNVQVMCNVARLGRALQGSRLPTLNRASQLLCEEDSYKCDMMVDAGDGTIASRMVAALPSKAQQRAEQLTMHAPAGAEAASDGHPSAEAAGFGAALQPQGASPMLLQLYCGSDTGHHHSIMCLWLQVLEAASAGNFNARTLRFGEPLSDRVDKSGCHYYLLELSQSHIDSGFVIGAHSSAGSRFKLLMFERTREGQWDLMLQEDSMKVSTLYHVTSTPP